MARFPFPGVLLLIPPPQLFHLIPPLFNKSHSMEVTSAPPAYEQDKIAERIDQPQFEEEGQLKGEVHDAFGNEEYAEIKYKTLQWWYVSFRTQLSARDGADA
jgi:hypothetical protein